MEELVLIKWLLINWSFQQRRRVDGSKFGSRLLYGFSLDALSDGHLSELAGNLGYLWRDSGTVLRIQFNHWI